MWETIKEILEILNGSNAWFILVFVTGIVVLLAIFSRMGLVKVNAKHIQIGNDLTQRELIRRQVETAYMFIMSLEGKIINSSNEYNKYLTKYILERIYDKVIEWIIFNHITTNELYVKDKQENVCNLVYTIVVSEDFKTPEFKRRMCDWTRELIEMLVKVREVYK